VVDSIDEVLPPLGASSEGEELAVDGVVDRLPPKLQPQARKPTMATTNNLRTTGDIRSIPLERTRLSLTEPKLIHRHKDPVVRVVTADMFIDYQQIT
jgi:hypothetical protein